MTIGKYFILNDENYFTLKKIPMPGNDIYYSADPKTVDGSVRFKFKKNYESKMILYIAVSTKGVSEPYFKTSSLTTNQKIYQEECLSRILISFIQKHHNNDDYVFWPNKASEHYSKKTISFLQSKNITFLPKEHNSTNLPQCHPMKDFFGELSSLVYKKGWNAKSIKQLKGRIHKCLKTMDTAVYNFV